MSDLFAKLMHFDYVQALGAVMALATAFQTLCLVVGTVWKPALKAAHVVGVIAVDLGKLGGLVKPAAAKMGALGKSIAKNGLYLIVACLAVTGIASACARPAHFSDPSLEKATSDVCSVLASQNMPELERQATAQGFTLDHVVAIFKGACQARALAGAQPAKLAGFAAVRGQPDLSEASDAGAP